MTTFQVRRDADGWHLASPSLGIEMQLATFPTRSAAVTFMRAMCELHYVEGILP